MCVTVLLKSSRRNKKVVEVVSIEEKKKNRLQRLQVRLSEEEEHKLNTLCEITNKNKTQIVIQGINLQYNLIAQEPTKEEEEEM